LQGGSYLLLEIDIQPLKIKKLDDKAVEIRKILREENINYKNFNIAKEGISFEINDIKNKEQTIKLLEGSKTKSDFFDKITGSSQNEKKEIILKIQNLNFNINFSEDFERKIKKDAMSQSLEIVRKRIDQLGTKEPNIQQKGDIRIIVELPGLSDPSTFKNILGKTAQLSFKFLKSSSDILGSEKIKSKIDGSILDVEKRLILSGENLVDAQPGYDQQN
ncbi:MAG: protein translocase subunit SecD, partial [Candidatus Fonsibacter sp.]